MNIIIIQNKIDSVVLNILGQRLEDKEIVISNPSVAKVNMMGQETFQITGEVHEESISSAPEISEEDVKTVATQAHVSEGKAKEALEETHGDLAQAILHLQK